ncbi:MAG TPA: tetratricopeptide repeat protein, partial [Leptospiraceae bacterium]|nr:tetratricopeptide repeat protein [Leptospiraceae bacterium]
GVAYYCLEDFLKAIDDCAKAIELDPNKENVHFYKALAHTKMLNYDSAIQDYQKCIELNPSDPNYYSSISQIFFILNRYLEAVEFLNKAFSLNPTNQSLLSELYFYIFAHIPERREEAKQKLQELIAENIQENGENSCLSEGWVFFRNIEKAIADGHPKPDLLKEFAKKITGKQ